ncbi:hypothetical protein [Falsiroseomonas selenitidurans]|uniref:Uncharacterized protein n=1 Tax=Falsiroseomonas selenitidurans TaxID=2716335 RepID=A0ABX1E9C0_9PROT|nr:hypothetical protein [Falsiroseomonas selenitidurans]NKC33471.1 hypothetical protein [Falsiroseomonas selenitidurans]
MNEILQQIAARRRGQVAHGYDAAHDDAHTGGELALAAAAYAAAATTHGMKRRALQQRRGLAAALYPFEGVGYLCQPRRDSLLAAAALLVAEIERLDRAAGAPAEDHGAAPKPDMFAEFDSDDWRESMEEALEITGVLDIVCVQRAQRLPDVFAVRMPHEDFSGIMEFASLAEAEAYVAELTTLYDAAVPGDA